MRYRHLFLCAAILAYLAVPVMAQDQTASATPCCADVRLESHSGVTHFKLGDPITLDLVFSRTQGNWTVNPTQYGDLADDVQISPAEGWYRWHGRSGHDYSMTQKLEDKPIHVPIVLNEGIAFREPGHYEITVRTSRLSGRRDAVAGPLSIDIDPMDPAEERALVRTLSNQIATAKGPAQSHAAQQLAFLTGDEAAREKVKWLAQDDIDVRREIASGLASSQNLALQLQLLEDVWHDVRHAPDMSILAAINQTRAAQNGKTSPGWQMVIAPSEQNDITRRAAAQHHDDIQQIIDTLPHRTGQNLTDTAYYLAEYAGLDASQTAVVHPFAVAEFPHMDPIAQAMLIETRWKEFKDPALVSGLRAMLDSPKGPDDLGATLQRLIELDPVVAKPYVVRFMCAPKANLQIRFVAQLPEDTLPETDACLTEQLSHIPASLNNNAWNDKASLAARFASKDALPALRSLAQQTSAPGLLAYWLRYEPAAATAHLSASPHNVDRFFEINNVYKARHTYFPPELQAWLRTLLQSESSAEVSTAAYELSFGGVPEDRILLEERLAQLRHTRAAQSPPSTDLNQLENELMSDLRMSHIWYVNNADAARLAARCATDYCRVFGEPRPEDKPFPVEE